MIKLLRRILLALLALCVLGYASLEAIVLLGGRDETGRNAPVMIVLGAKLWADGPSPALQRRLDKAYDYWQDHPALEIIVSGGQGADEPEPEAQAMADYLEARGVPEGQLHLEDSSTNTSENLQYSMEIMVELGYDPADTPVIVVSNRFHLARVRLLCGRYGLEADTLGAPMPDPKSALYSYGREALALLKSFLFD